MANSGSTAAAPASNASAAAAPPKTRKTRVRKARAATASRIPATTATAPSAATGIASDINALDRLTSAYLRGGNGSRTLGTINVLEFIGWANEYGSARPKAMTAGSSPTA